MTPRAATAAHAGAVHPIETAGAQPILEVVERRARRRRARRRRVLPILSTGLVSLSLLAVVVGHAELAQDQVRLAQVESSLTRAEGIRTAETVAVGELENPQRIATVAQGTLHMVAPAQVLQLPYVALSTPLATPTVAPATPPPAQTTASSTTPAQTTASSTTPAQTTASSTASTTGSSAPTASAATTAPASAATSTTPTSTPST